MVAERLLVAYAMVLTAYVRTPGAEKFPHDIQCFTFVRLPALRDS